MNTSKYTIPYVPVLDALDLSSNEIIMEEQSLRLPIMHNSWPDQYPYVPLTAVDVAYTDTGLYLRFQSRGKGLRAQYGKDGDPVHRDSCVEAFLQLPGDERYYNFEFNCIGTCDAGHRLSREKNTPFTATQYGYISRAISERAGVLFERPLGIHYFTVSVKLDFKVFGIEKPEEIPATIKANFYKCGDDTTIPHFASWHKVEAPEPDFHRPESFLTLDFGKRKK